MTEQVLREKLRKMRSKPHDSTYGYKKCIAEGEGALCCVAEFEDELVDLIKRRVEEARDPVYKERDALVCVLSKCFPSHLTRHPDSDKEWEDDWRWIVCVHLPTGQATWHIHDSERGMFKHLSVFEDNHWDGHTTEEKYQRLANLKEER